MTLGELETAANARFLTIVGAFHPTPDDNAPIDTKTLLMLGPDEPRFWGHFIKSPEYLNSQSDPLDRWSKRVIGDLASQINGTAQFPSDGPPYPPFIAWALRCDGIWASPVGMLVHYKAGLFISFRGAIALPDRVVLSPPSKNPCDTCPKPCLTACPVNALAGASYDVPACKTYLDTDPTNSCMETGCFVRRSCPISQKYGRVAHQSAFHMASFNPQ